MAHAIPTLSHARVLLWLGVTALLLVGCDAKTSSSAAPFAAVTVGMTLDDAGKHLDGPGEARDYDNLPASLKPRDMYKKLPADTKWLIWSGQGKPTLILGVVNGKIAFKQVMWSDGGQVKSDAWALPEYQ